MIVTVSLLAFRCILYHAIMQTFSINFSAFIPNISVINLFYQKQIGTGTCINLHFIVFGEDVPRVHHFGGIRSFCLVSGGSSREASEWNQTVALSNLVK